MSIAKVKLDIPTLHLSYSEFKKLQRILYTTTGENDTACAKLCGVSRATWIKWYHTPPTMPHWNMILRHLITELLATMRGRRNSSTNAIWTKVHDDLAKVPQGLELENAALTLFGKYTTAEDHLRRLLMKGGMSTKKIFKTANMEGHTARSLQRAALSLGIVKDVRGFGDKKKTYWRLPTYESLTLHDDTVGLEEYETPLDELAEGEEPTVRRRRD